MTADYRAELQLLFDAAESFTEPALGHHRAWEAAMDRARTLLDQPEPEGLTDEDLLRTYGLSKRDHCYEGDSHDWPKKAERAATVAGLRAVLARHGRPTPQPDTEGLTDEELDALAQQCYAPVEVYHGRFGEFALDGLRYARAVIAADRARRPTPQPPANALPTP
jgi:hypothetical protein